jgi:hypothetical protein
MVQHTIDDYQAVRREHDRRLVCGVVVDQGSTCGVKAVQPQTKPRIGEPAKVLVQMSGLKMGGVLCLDGKRE